MSVSELLSAFRGAKADISGLRETIAALEDERSKLLSLPPDRQAVLAWALRGVDRLAAAGMENHTGWYFSPETLAKVPGEWFESDAGPNFLGHLETAPGVRFSDPVLPQDALVPADSRALALLLAPLPRQAVTQLVEQTFVQAPNAISTSDRRARISKIEARLARENERLARLVETLDEGTKAVRTELL